MEIVIAADVPTLGQNLGGESSRAGSYNGQRLLQGDAPDGLNFVFLRNQFFLKGDEAFRTPRHRHTFAQIKFVEKGSSNFAPDQFIFPGDICYFPRGAYYGPQLKDDGTSIGMQFGFNGQHQKGKVWEGYRAEALQRLKARGTVADGTFTEIDPVTGETQERDGVEAIYAEQYEMHTNQKFVVPPEGYEAPILMHPKAFSYYQAGPGVELKHLGCFYDQPGPNGDVRISMARLSDGGVYRLSAERAQLAWTTSAGLQINGRSYPELTSLYCPRGEDGAISGADGVEVYVVEFPRLD